MKKHKVEQGECMVSIAELYGFWPDSIWDHPSNEALRKKRGDSRHLLPGDEVTIPDKRVRVVHEHTGHRHVYRLKGIPAYVRMQFLHPDGSPRAYEEWTLEVDGKKTQGRTNVDGLVLAPISPKVQEAKLTFGEVTYDLQLGHLDPVQEISGAQARLRGLGYACEVSGDLDDATREALRSFQVDHGVEPTGELDEATTQRLGELHDAVSKG